MQENIIAGLDLGSNTIRIALGQKTAPEEGGKLRIIGIVEAPAEGINRGLVTNAEVAIQSIVNCLEKAERIVGLPIEHAWIGLSGHQIVFQPSRAAVAVSRTDGEIKPEDMERVVEAARAVAIPPNYEVIHVLPRYFVVDNQITVKDPLGLTGIKLETEAHIIQALNTEVKNLTKCLLQAGIEPDDLVYSGLATAEAVLDFKQKEVGVAVVNIGATTTTIIVFEGGDLIHAATIPIGSHHITADIAIGLRVSLETAERIKLEYGTTLSDEISKKEEIDLADLGTGETDTASKKYIAEIIEARVEEIFEKIDKEFKKINRSGMLPVGVILTGGGAKLPGIIEIAKKKLRLPASISRLTIPVSTLERAQDPAYSTAIGLVLWGEQLERMRGERFGRFFSWLPRKDWLSRTKNWFRELLP